MEGTSNPVNTAAGFEDMLEGFQGRQAMRGPETVSHEAACLRRGAGGTS